MNGGAMRLGEQAQFLPQARSCFTDSHTLNPNKFISKSNIKYSINLLPCRSTKSSSNWDHSNSTEPTASGSGRFRYNLEDEDLYTDGNDDFSPKRRSWSSDYDYDPVDHREFDEEDESWILKIFQAFGWMLPVIAISLLLGTAPNALFMALIPLGQSVLSLALDKVWARTGNSPNPRTRNKRKRQPFVRAATNPKTSQSREDTEAANGSDYQSWVVADGVSYEGDKNGPRFGGWDDLDEKVENYGYRAARKPQNQKKCGQPQRKKKVKFSRLGRIRETPMLLRLLIAVFPFLGSWTKMLL